MTRLTFFQLLQLGTEEFENWLYRMDACYNAISRFRGLSAVQAFLCLSPIAEDWDLVRWVAARIKSSHLNAILMEVHGDLVHMTPKRLAYAEALVELDKYSPDHPGITAIWKLYQMEIEAIEDTYKNGLICIREWALDSAYSPLKNETGYVRRFIWEVPREVWQIEPDGRILYHYEG